MYVCVLMREDNITLSGESCQVSPKAARLTAPALARATSALSLWKRCQMAITNERPQLAQCWCVLKEGDVRVDIIKMKRIGVVRQPMMVVVKQQEPEGARAAQGGERQRDLGVVSTCSTTTPDLTKLQGDGSLRAEHFETLVWLVGLIACIRIYQHHLQHGAPHAGSGEWIVGGNGHGDWECVNGISFSQPSVS